MKIKTALLVPALFLCLLAFALPVRAFDPGTMDQTFNPGTGANGVVYALALQDDGKILVGGDFTTFRSVSQGHLTRINPDGTLDTEFSANIGTGADAVISAIAVKVDRQIAVVGKFTHFNGVKRNGVALLNADGTLVKGFDVGDGAGVVFRVIAQDDGKLLVGGSFSLFNGWATANVARLNADGSVDLAYTSDLGRDFTGFNDMIQQRDGKLLVAGDYYYDDSGAAANVARLDTDGRYDASYRPPKVTDSDYFVRVHSIALQRSGKLVGVGDSAEVDEVGGTASSQTERLNLDGSNDDTFTTNNYSADGQYFNLAVVQPNDKVLIGFLGVGGMYRVNADGTEDTAFHPTYNKRFYAMVVQPDGNIVVGGDFSGGVPTDSVNIARLHGDTGPGQVEFKAANFSTVERAASVAVSVRRIGGTVGSIYASYSRYDGTAKAGTDYRAGRGVLNWADGDGSVKNINVPLLDPKVTDNGTRTFTIKVGSVGGGAKVGPNATTNVNIHDDDLPAPVITSPETARAIEGKAFFYRIKATNKPTSFGVVGLPPGLKVDGKTGVISGTPTVSGVKTLTLKAANTDATGTATLSLTIVATPAITSPTDATATLGTAFSYQITATNSPTSFGVLGLPPGLHVDASTGLISGTPTTSGQKSLTLKATNAAGTGMATLTLTITAN